VLQRLQKKKPDVLAQALATSLARAGFDVSAYGDYIARVRGAVARGGRLDLRALRAYGLDDLIRSFLGYDGTHAVGLSILFPKQELWTTGRRDVLWHRIDRVLASQQLQGTLTDLYSVSSQSARAIGADFLRVTLLASAAIGLVICLRFRHLPTIGLVLLPVLCGTLWTVGLLSLCGLKVNFMNIAIVPMILGIGIDDGIHIVHRVRLQGTRDVQVVLQLTGAAVCLSSITTISAFGTLALSTNRGIASVGLLTLVGVSACLIASLCTLPAALHLWQARENA
jgi:predicted RND superfamily exporter protein